MQIHATLKKPPKRSTLRYLIHNQTVVSLSFRHSMLSLNRLKLTFKDSSCDFFFRRPTGERNRSNFSRPLTMNFDKKKSQGRRRSVNKLVNNEIEDANIVSSSGLKTNRKIEAG